MLINRRGFLSGVAAFALPPTRNNDPAVAAAAKRPKLTWIPAMGKRSMLRVGVPSEDYRQGMISQSELLDFVDAAESPGFVNTHPTWQVVNCGNLPPVGYWCDVA